MKKLKLILLLTGIVSSQAFSQSVNNTVPATLSRSQKIVTNAPNAFVNAVSGTTYTSNQALPKNGGMPSVAVAYSDDFSLPNDIAGLEARGYLPYYRGTGPAGTTAAWFQGNVTNWGDFNGGTNEFVHSNFNSVTGANDIDNWLVLPALNIVSGDVISFYSRSFLNSTFPDSIRVMYSAVGDSVPEDLSWVELGRFKVNITGAWLLNSFIAPANGTTARFAIRYTVADGGPQGTNSDIIGIDQLDVFTPSAFDIQSMNVSGLNPQYTIIPLNQASPISLSGEVKNNGINATTGGTALFEIFDTLTSAVVFNETVNLPAINAGATAFYQLQILLHLLQLLLRGRLTVSFPGDGNSSNDIITGSSTTFSDSIYARDDNQTSGSLGIGAGPADGIVGQNFEIANATTLTSVSFFMRDNFSPNPAGTPIYATIHAQTAGSAPNNTVLATTDSLIFLPGQIATGGEWFTLPIDGASLPLTSVCIL
ncbi:MAG: choice-of-anchor J domain-containing protein [Bacteroidetes bacterium]|nr:choice-of-anchor J domain-containing protein [Bacteroidota bacterium]